MGKTMKKSGWWHEFFPAWRPMFEIMAPRDTNTQVQYLVKKLALRSGRRFLDCPCGIGRVSLPMARMGVEVTGVDITPSYLEELHKKAKRARLKIETVHSDMRRIDFANVFDAAGNLWGSLGYFEKESDHLLTLKRAYRALKPGGRFVVHTINRDWIVLNFQARGWTEVGGLKVCEERVFDYERSINRTTWTFIDSGRERVLPANMRMWSLHELLDLFRRAGFISLESFASEKDEPVSRTQRNMYVFGTKPK